MSDGFQFSDIIILAVIAVFIILRLRSNLGRRIGFDGTPTRPAAHEDKGERVIQLPERQPKAPNDEEDALMLADIANPELAAGLMAIKTADPSFNAKSFVEGAKTAFDMVFNAFAAADKTFLKNLLSEEVYQRFAAEIDRREKAEEKEEATLVSILSQEIAEVTLEKNIARISMRFVSEQIHLVRNKDRVIVGGDPSAVEQVEDEWTFERDVRSRNPNWKITAT